ncbi:helix-turn-helix domain-containing protein [Sinomicrobium sp. M5D2P9]
MNLESQLIFFFSALGAFNGLLLSVYFALIAKKKKFSNYFLALLLFVLSIRIIKSVFLYFSPHLSDVFIHIGLSACVVIGPFLYLYIRSQTGENNTSWAIHIFPFIIAVGILGWIYPYWTYKTLWSPYIVKIIYAQWFIYILLSSVELKDTFKKLYNKQKINEIEIWVLSIFIGTTLIWLAYTTSYYTSYIVGALSFSFVFYLFVLLWIFKSNKNTLFFQEKEKYKGRKIDEDTMSVLSGRLVVIEEQGLYKNPELKLSALARALNVPPHTLSQFLNDNLEKSFTEFINEYRIEEAKRLLVSNDHYTIEGIGYESGFNSKSTFFTAFKKITGTTPSKYRKKRRAISHKF